MEFTKAMEIKKRMTNNCQIECEDCQLFTFNNGKDKYCSDFIVDYPQLVEEILKKWDEKNHNKTYLDDFKEKFPKDVFTDTFISDNCVAVLYFDTNECMIKDSGAKVYNCLECWNQPYKEDK